MGRQKTIWINEERNSKLDAIVAGSMSEKIGLCIDAYSVDLELRYNAALAREKVLRMLIENTVKDLVNFQQLNAVPKTAALKALARELATEMWWKE